MLVSCRAKKYATCGFVAPLLAIIFSVTSFPASAQSATPVCQLSESDSDNDGWGWENGTSCIVAGSEAAQSNSNEQAVNYCLYLASDDDGDGWGWEDNASCQVGSASSGDLPTTDIGDYVPVIDSRGRNICQNENADPDGDGYGWENNTSCVVSGSAAESVATAQENTLCTSASADPDGDGWGWENGASCVVDADADTGTADSGTDTTDSGTDTTDSGNDTTDSGNDTTDSGNDTTDSGNDTTDTTDTTDTGTTDTDTDATEQEFQPLDITDLILVTGQSNTLGANATIDESLDGPHPRVFAYTANGWQIAELYQSWDNGAHPGTGRRSDVTKIHNNFALHFGKRLAELDENAVVGFLLVSEPGEGIEHWNPGRPGLLRVQAKTLQAINELPQKSAIDGILWHQGETDWQEEGTSDPDIVQPAPVDYYPVQLASLIENLRLENWFNNSKPFICGETILAVGVNIHLNSLNTDGDPFTACVEGEGLPAITVEGSHFDASALRTIGARYADRYHAIQ